MQTRDYDDHIYVFSLKGFRQVNDQHTGIITDQETDMYCTMYADGIAVSNLHSMSSEQLNAIHYFEENHVIIFNALVEHLSKVYTKPKEKLGFTSINILNSGQDDSCYSEYTFIDESGKKIKITLHKNKLINS